MEESLAQIWYNGISKTIKPEMGRALWMRIV
jgi:hypothetical protein